MEVIMAIKYFVDEEDVGNFGTPLRGVRKETQLFETYSDADKVCDEWSKGDIVFQVWEYNTDTGAIRETFITDHKPKS